MIRMPLIFCVTSMLQEVPPWLLALTLLFLFAGKEEKEENHYNSLKMEASSLRQGGCMLEAELMECK